MRRYDYLMVGVFILIFVVVSSTVGHVRSRRAAGSEPFVLAPVPAEEPLTLRQPLLPRQERGYPWDILVIHDGSCGAPVHLRVGQGEISRSASWDRQEPVAHAGDPHLDGRAISLLVEGSPGAGGPTPAQLDELEGLVRELRRLYKIPLRQVVGHRELPGAPDGCPGPAFPRRILQRLRGEEEH